MNYNQIKTNYNQIYQMTKKELLEVAKGFEIVGRWDMTKDELIKAIKDCSTGLEEEVENINNCHNNFSDIVTSAEEDNEIVTLEEISEEINDWDAEEITNNSRAERMCEKEIIVNGEKKVITAVNQDIKDRFIENAELEETIVAFVDNGKYRSAMLANRNRSKRLVKLVTKLGKEYIVPYEDIVWVRDGNKWPLTIYNLLKGEPARCQKIQ